MRRPRFEDALAVAGVAGWASVVGALIVCDWRWSAIALSLGVLVTLAVLPEGGSDGL